MISYQVTRVLFIKLFMKLSFEMSNFVRSKWSCLPGSPTGASEWIFMWFLRSPGVEKDRGHSSQGWGFSLTWVMRW